MIEISIDTKNIDKLNEKLLDAIESTMLSAFKDDYAQELKNVIDSRTEGLFPRTTGHYADPRLAGSGYRDYWNYWSARNEGQTGNQLNYSLKNSQPYFNIRADERRGLNEGDPQKDAVFYRAGNEAKYLYEGTNHPTEPRQDSAIPAKCLMYYIDGEERFASRAGARGKNPLFGLVLQKSVTDGAKNTLEKLSGNFQERLEKEYGRL